MKTLLSFVIILTNFFANAIKPCAHRDYGKGGTVCVCNTTYCDTFPEISRTAPGIITLYESNKNGKRFESKTLEFSNNSEPDWTEKVVEINRNTRYQKIIGFGGAFSDSAAFNILSLEEKLSQNLIKDYYSPNGLSYTMGRLPMGGTDFSPRYYTYDDTSDEDLELKNFSLQEEDLNYKIPVIKMAQNENSNLQLLASPWTAPGWMKKYGYLKGDPGGTYYKAWAQYFVKFLNAYKENGINIWGVGAQNEPCINRFLPVNSTTLNFSAKQQRDFIINDLGPALKQANYGLDKLELIIADGTLFILPVWTTVILSDSRIAEYVSGIGFHWYFNYIVPPETLDLAHLQFPNYFLLSTEASNGLTPLDIITNQKVVLGSWERGERYAIDILRDLLHYTNGWIDWNLALDVRGGPSWHDNWMDATIIVNSTAQEYYKQPMYYNLAHFTKFLAPNSQRIDTKDSGIQRLDTIVFETPDNGTVLIALNQNDYDIPLRIIDPNIGALKTTVSSHSIHSYVWYN